MLAHSFGSMCVYHAPIWAMQNYSSDALNQVQEGLQCCGVAVHTVGRTALCRRELVLCVLLETWGMAGTAQQPHHFHELGSFI